MLIAPQLNIKTAAIFLSFIHLPHEAIDALQNLKQGGLYKFDIVLSCPVSEQPYEFVRTRRQ